MQDDVKTSEDENGKVDSIAAVMMITIVISTLVFWLTNQPVS